MNRFRFILAVLLMFINTTCYAAVVSDYDGRAFITKEEFDALKTDFDRQISQYNEAIDSKIDGAIAAYLRGIMVEQPTAIKVENSSWNYVKMTNYQLPQTWKAVDHNINLTLQGWCIQPTDAKTFNEWCNYANISYTRGTDSQQIRNVVNAGDETSTGTPKGNLVWLGRSMDYQDSITIVRFGNRSTFTNEIGTGGNIGFMGDMSNGTLNGVHLLNIPKGYTLSDTYMNDCNIGVYWNTNDANYLWEWDWTKTLQNKYAIKANAYLRKVNNKKYYDEHILNYSNVNWNSLSDPNWVNTIGENPDIVQKDVLDDNSIVFSQWSGTVETVDGMNEDRWKMTGYGDIGTNYNYKPQLEKTYTNKYSGTYNADSYESFVSVGVLSGTYDADKIMQWEDDGTSNSGYQYNRKLNTKAPQMNLINGYLVATVNKGENFEWTPVISGRYNKELTADEMRAGWTTEKAAESTDKSIKVAKWNVSFATCYFDNFFTLERDESGNPKGDYLHMTGDTDDNYYYTTDENGKLRFKFKADKDCIVVAKWWPADKVTIDGDEHDVSSWKSWWGELDLTKCGTYNVSNEV